jgi:two-component system response regulator FixJ
MQTDSIVYVVDDDASIRASVEYVCRAAGRRCVSFASLSDFLDADHPNVPSCLVLDLRLSGECGLDIFDAWKSRGQAGIPIIIVTGTGDVPTAVKSLKLGAMDFLEKPADPILLMARVDQALQSDAAQRSAITERNDNHDRLKDLTTRERELLKMICSGLSNKQISLQLKISIKTVANHRAHILAKAKAVNTADMVRLAVLANQA